MYKIRCACLHVSLSFSFSKKIKGHVLRGKSHRTRIVSIMSQPRRHASGWTFTATVTLPRTCYTRNTLHLCLVEFGLIAGDIPFGSHSTLETL